jgi:hypothetical protein
MLPALCAIALGSLLQAASPPPPALHEQAFHLDTTAEAVATLTLRCPTCDWGTRGREAAVLRLEVDGRYSQHLVTARGSGDYRVGLGPLSAGPHTLRLSADPSSDRSPEVAVDDVTVQAVAAGSPEHEALAHAPILHLRPDTPRRFTDLPLLTWYERAPAADGGQRLRYSVVFSNEDGGTPPDRLMATWGRVTDIEYVYGVELDAGGAVRHEEFQGRDHALLEFAGRHEGRHPLLWVATANNMLDAAGPPARRVAPAPVPFDLSGTSREALMDVHPWTYQVSAAEVRREGRVKDGARPGSKRISDPRRYVYLEACAEMTDAALAFAVAVRTPAGGLQWAWSHGGPLAWHIARNPDHFPNGCFRGAVALPAGTRPDDLAGLRFRSFPRARREGEPPPPSGAGGARLLRINRLFMLQADDTPGPSRFQWSGELPLRPAGPAQELAIPRR